MEKVVELLKKYVDTQLEILSIKTEQEVNVFVGRLVMLFIILTIAASAVLFISLTLALLFNHLLESAYIGFGIVAIFYGILFGILISRKGRKFLTSKVIFLNRYFIYSDKKEEIHEKQELD